MRGREGVTVRQRRVSVPAVLAWSLLSVPHAVAAAELAAIEWTRPAGESAERLVLRFRSAPPPVGVAVEPGGLELRIAGVSAGSATAPGVAVEAEDGGVRLRVQRPGVVLRGIAYDADSVAISLASVGSQAGASPTGGSPAGSEYQIGVGDVVSVSVYKNPELGGELAVGPDGTITMPLVGTVPAKGRTEAQLADEVRRLLDDVLVDPQVSVSVKSYQSQFAYVSGSVGRGDRVALRTGMTMKDVLAQAGVALGPQQVVLLTRAGQAEPRALLAEDVETGRTPPPLHGDVLTVQDRGFVVLNGEFRRPGRVPYRPGLTLLEAIASVEGLSDWASKKDIRILRKDERGAAGPEQVVDLRAVESGRAPDPVLQAGDIVLVRRRFL